MTTHLLGMLEDRTLCGMPVNHLPAGDNWLYVSSASSCSCNRCLAAVSAPVTVQRQTLTVHEDNDGHPNPNPNPEGQRWRTVVGGGFLTDVHQEHTKQLEAKVAELEKQVSLLTLITSNFLTSTYDSEVSNAVYEALNKGQLPNLKIHVYKDETGCFHCKPGVVSKPKTSDPLPAKTSWDRILTDDEVPSQAQQLTLDLGDNGPGTHTSGHNGD